MNNKKIFWLVIGLIVIHALINWIWLRRDTFPLWFDYAGYFNRSLIDYQAVKGGWVHFLLTVIGIEKNDAVFFPHRLFLPLSSVPWYFVFGADSDVAVMSCTVFLAIALLSIYGIGAKCFDRSVGFWSAFILSTSVGFFIFCRRYSPEFASTALFALSFYFYLMSENLRKRSYALLLGLSLGLAMLTKELLLAYIPGIALYAIYRFLRDKTGRREFLFNGGIFLLIFLAITLPVYWTHRQVFLSRVFLIYSREEAKAYALPLSGSLPGALFYFKALFSSFQPFYGVLSLLGLFLAYRNGLKQKNLFLMLFLISLAILSSTQIKAEYYAIPLLIPLSIFAGYAVNMIFKHKLTIMKAGMILWGLLNVLHHSFPQTNFKQWRIFAEPNGYANYYYPISEDWRLGEIIDYLRNNIQNDRVVPRVHVGANLYPFSAMTMIYVATQKKLNAAFCGYNVPNNEALNCDFLIVKSGENQGLFYPSQQAKELLRNLERNGKFVQLAKTFTLPDRSVVIIFKKR